jgi:hypothetical protein
VSRLQGEDGNIAEAENLAKVRPVGCFGLAEGKLSAGVPLVPALIRAERFASPISASVCSGLLQWA